VLQSISASRSGDHPICGRAPRRGINDHPLTRPGADMNARTNRRLTALAAALLAVLTSAIAGADAPEKAAQAAAEGWLKLVDAGNYDRSWQEAAGLFKKAVPKEQWSRQVGAARSPLGALRSRKLKSAKFTRTLPGAPDGQYVVIQYSSSFANKASAVETVTPLLDQDGKWRVSGYYIK
jgi:hypothetical protein